MSDYTLTVSQVIDPSTSASEPSTFLEKLHGFMGVNGMYDFRDGSQRGLTGTSVIIARWEPAKHTWIADRVIGKKPSGSLRKRSRWIHLIRFPFRS